jgi:hypothetical protein
MPLTDEQKRLDFTDYLKQIKQRWTINRETERSIIIAILQHKNIQLDLYISYFKVLIQKIETNKNSFLDIRSKEHPVGGRYVEVFIGPTDSVEKRYLSNRSLLLYFVDKLIYDFEVWH